MLGIFSLVRNSVHVPAACEVASSILVGIQNVFMSSAYHQMVAHSTKDRLARFLLKAAPSLGWRMQLPLFNQLHSRATGIAKLRRGLLVLTVFCAAT